MTSVGSTWRKHPFVSGQHYVACESFRGFGESQFIVGEVYEFKGAAYSHYDSSTVFTFQSEVDRRPIDWWFGDEEQEGVFSQRFKKRNI